MRPNLRRLRNLARIASRSDRRLRDVLFAVCWVAVGIAQLLVPHLELWDDGLAYRPMSVVSWMLTALVTVPLLWRRENPVAAFVVSFGALSLLIIGDYNVGLLPFATWALIYSIGAYAERRWVPIPLALAVVGIVAAKLTSYPGFDWSDAARNLAFFATWLVVGLYVAASRRNTVWRLEMADQRSVVATQRARTAVVEERLRLAQELHDIVAHSMSVISVQASMGSATFDTAPGQARRALANIEHTSSSTIAELRSLLSVLRDDSGARVDLAPTPSLRGVDLLVANVEGAGLSTTLKVSGPLLLPEGVDAFGYRIVQEALTNVLKHAHASEVSITIHDDGHVVALHVIDNGIGTNVPNSVVSDGHGIIGMRERVATFRGTLRIGPTSRGGYQVLATIPYAASLVRSDSR